MILLDAIVLIYAVGTPHPLREPCRRLLQAHGEGHIEATTTIEALQEFVHVRARRRSRQDAVALARHYSAAFPLLVTRAEDFDLGLAMFERGTSLGTFDCVLAAVALNRHLEALVSADKAFGELPELLWINPATTQLDRIIHHSP